jgi:uncharacterized protein YndB with AHSA1/START domain
MNTTESTRITVAATIQAPIEKVWKFWTDPKHITQWNQASDDWHSLKVENDLRIGGKFHSRMEAKDGSVGFDFSGSYTAVEEHKRIAYTLDDDRKVELLFEARGDETTVTETFDAEQTNPADMQQAGWQAILDSFKQYVEAKGKLVPVEFHISIHAPAEKVYRTMLDEKHYAAWTAEFNPGSRYKGSWEKGAKILFLGTDKDGKEEGMVSRIKENIPNRMVSIEHLGVLDNGKEVTTGPAVAGWAGAVENYYFTEANGETLVEVYVETAPEYQDYFSETWPKALQKLKAICESAG